MHTIEIFSQTMSRKHLVILAFVEAEFAGGQILLPSWARNSEAHSRARANIFIFGDFSNIYQFSTKNCMTLDHLSRYNEKGFGEHFPKFCVRT